jgi:hypothetical protein
MKTNDKVKIKDTGTKHDGKKGRLRKYVSPGWTVTLDDGTQFNCMPADLVLLKS